MGSAISHSAGSSTSTGCTAKCLCNKLPNLRRRWLESLAAMGGQSSAIVTEARRMDLDGISNDARTVARQLNQTYLRWEESNVYPSVFDFVAMQTRLRSLTLRNIENDAQVGIILKTIPYLDTPATDDYDQLVTGGPHVLLASFRLRRVVLGIGTIDRLIHSLFLECTANVSLTLYGLRRMDDPQKIRAIKNLVSLKFVNFLTMDYPLWVKCMGKLQSLSFDNGTVRETHEDYTVFFPRSLTHFSSRVCKMDQRIVDAILYNGYLLHELELDLPCLTKDIPIRFCSGLRILKISAVECDGDALRQLSVNKHLCNIDLCGCLRMEAKNLSAFHSLSQLHTIAISNSSLGQGCCHLLTSLHCLRSLEFYATRGIDLTELAGANNIRKLSLVKCIDLLSKELGDDRMSEELDGFMASELVVQKLDSLAIEF